MRTSSACGCRAGPPVPAFLAEGVKDTDVKPLLDKVLPHVNKALSERCCWNAIHEARIRG